MATEKYRVFVTRHYIDVEFFDIEVESRSTKGRTLFAAKKLAETAAYKIKSDARATATDNGWIAEDPTEIEFIGYSSVPLDQKNLKVVLVKGMDKVWQEEYEKK